MHKKKVSNEAPTIYELRKSIEVLNYTPLDYFTTEIWSNFVTHGFNAILTETLASVSPDEFTSDMFDPIIDAKLIYELNQLAEQYTEHLHAINNHYGKVNGATKKVEEDLATIKKDLDDIQYDLNYYLGLQKSLREGEQNYEKLSYQS